MSYIRLNVGGQLFVTSSSTLNKLSDSFYHPLRLNYPRDPDGTIMIDRNPKYFGYILDFLRMLGTEQKFHIPDSVDRNEFINEVCLINSIQELNFFHSLNDYLTHDLHFRLLLFELI